MRRRRQRATLLIGAIGAIGALAALASGCGADDFPNEPRPPSPIELTARIGDEAVTVSPTMINGAPIGGGLVNVTVSNLTNESVRLTFAGPTDETSDPIVGGGVLDFTIDLEEGFYSVAVDDPAITGFDLTVGPERSSSQNELLLP